MSSQTNTALIAVAGAGKTTRLARAVSQEPDMARVVVLTYTTTNQLEDASRVSSCLAADQFAPRVIGWCSFLLNEIVRPYLPTLYPNVKLSGLAIREPASFQYLSREKRYFTSDGLVYPSFLGKLAFDVIKASNGAPINRLEDMLDAIYVDEAQDLRGNDLCVLEKLLESSIEVHLVLDPRQSTLATTSRDRKYKKYEAHKILDLYRYWEQRDLLTIRYENETHRSTALIASFSDIILGPNIGLANTTSKVKRRGRHDGIFLVRKDAIQEYATEYEATLLAQRECERYGVADAFNFGKAKGLTKDDVIIVASDPIEEFLSKGVPLKPKSACGFYVAVTRARYSVAIAVEDPVVTAGAMSDPESIWRDINAHVTRPPL